MPTTDVERLGLPCSDSAAPFYVADSAATALSTSTTSTTVTATVPLNIDGTQPLVTLGTCAIDVSGLTSTPYIASVEVTVDDGTHTIGVFYWTNAAHTAAQGVNLTFPIQMRLSDSCTTIKDVNAIITMSANAVTGSARVVFAGSP